MKTLQAVALSTLFAAGATNANDNGTNGTVVCNSSNTTDLLLVEVRTTNTPTSPLGSKYVEMDVLNQGQVPNVTPLVYSIILNGQVVETKQNPFAIQPGEYTVRFFSTNVFGTGSIPSATFRIDYPCSSNENNNEVTGPVPGTIRNPLATDLIFKDGFDVQIGQTQIEAAKAFGIDDGVYGTSSRKAVVVPVLTPKF